MRPVALALAAIAALAVAACGGESDGTFDYEGFPFTFSYPEDFEETEDIETSQKAGAPAEQTAGIGIDEDNAIVVQRYTVMIEVTEQNLPRVKPEVDALVRQFDPQAGPSEITEVAGLPALAAQIAVPSLDDGLSDFTFIFDGDQEYLINCQSTPDHREEVDEACAQALETLSFE
jgi:hypothetical protein